MSENRKVRYTKSVIRESYISLLSEKPIGKITVTEICELADINRGTFYQYYKDVYHLQETIEEELYAKMESMQPLRKDDSLAEITHAALSLLYAEKEICRVVLSASTDVPFVEKILGLSRKNSFDVYKRLGINEAHYDFIYSYILYGSIGIIRAWVENGFTQSVEDVTEYIGTLSRRGMSAYTEK